MNKIVELILRIVIEVVEFFISAAFVAFGWNVCLVKVFSVVPTLGFKDIVLLSLAIDFISYPALMGIAHTLNKIRKAIGAEL